MNGEAGHYYLINSLVGYCQTSKDNALLVYPRCNFAVVSSQNNGSGAGRYHKHVAKCEAIEKGETTHKFSEKIVKRIKSKYTIYLDH